MADADLVLRNARVATLDSDCPEATPLAVTNGCVLAVGDDTAVNALRTTRTKVIDRSGRRATTVTDGDLCAV